MKLLNKKWGGIFLLCIFFSLTGYSQKVTLSGMVSDENGSPMPGVSIVVDNQAGVGTSTDENGRYTISIEKGNVLSFSFIGYITQNITVGAQTVVNVQLKEDTEMLDEVVVVGYGVTKKSDLTGSVSTLKTDEISKGITTTPQDMITGKIAGVSVISDGGTPGGGSQIRIRGGSSLSASNDPLIVIDGLAIDNDGVKGLPNGLALVNPNDIETFTVLKDASATAIYGSRASNGVIIITTKKGSASSKLSVTYNGNVSAGVVRKTLDVLDANEYRSYITGLYGAENIPEPLGDANTDWQKEIYRIAIGTDHNVTVSGGVKDLPYRLSLGYTNQNGVLLTSNFERYTVQLNLSPTFFDDHLKVNLNTNLMYASNRYADAGAVGAAAVFDPTRPVKGNDMDLFGGYWQWKGAAAAYPNQEWNYSPNTLAPQNPVALLKLKNDSAKSTDMMGNLELDYKLHFFPDVRIHANIGGDYAEGDQHTLTSPYSYSNHYYGWDGHSREYKYNLTGNAYAQYIKDINQHSVNVMVGAEEQHFHRNWHNFGAGIVDNYNANDVFGATHSSLVSYFGRLNYTFMQKYLLTATVRQDGTSRFSKGNRWGTFPSVALAWRAKDESFLQNIDVLSELKVRLGYGVTGQQNINSGDFPFLPQYSNSLQFGYYTFGDNTPLITSRPNAYNPNLKWEETTTYNAGVDFGFWKGRLSGTVDYYYRETKDLLNTVKIPAGTNFNTMLLSNIGNLENYGLELTLNGKPFVEGDFTWDVSYNVSWNKNEITKLTGGDDPDYYVATGGISHGTGSTIQAHKVGYAANSFLVYQQVYDANGKPIDNLFVDRNADGLINDSDRYIYKKPTADVRMGLTSKMMYKNWDLSFALRASLNNYVYNDVIADRSAVGKSGMFNTGFYTNRPKDAIALGFEGTGVWYMSDYFVQNASFLRCDNITLGWSFKDFAKTTSYSGVNGRIYATVQNPFIITKYDGIDPEISSGIDNNIYPRPMTFLLGVSLSF
ncbi:MAG: TonB-dependent receptor [Culturomica sp.]|jgi:iron complex outermembrane receptor protein|nr:TonB-dependent receptor [Culturomica sp.]